VNFEIFNNLLRTSLTEQVYLGAALRKYKDDSNASEKRKSLYKFNTVTYGVPLIRIV
jgi:hypothetical protein